MRQDIYKEFEIVLHSVLTNLYPAISKMLEESGVFPSLEELREAMQRSMRRSAPKARPEPTQNYQELEAPVREAAMAADGISMAPRASYNPFVKKEGGTAEVYKAARELLNLGRRARACRAHRNRSSSRRRMLRRISATTPETSCRRFRRSNPNSAMRR